MSIPRIGHEVIVDFLEGDPDRPIVTGRVYHGTNRPPYFPPEHKTRTTFKSDSSKGGGGFNELRFEDLKGQEQVYIHAEKDQDNVVKHNETTKVGNDRSETVGANETISIGANRSESVGANEQVTIALTRTHSIGINDMLNVGAAQEVTVGAMRLVTVGLSQQVRIGKTLTIEAGDEIILRTGKAVLHMQQDGTINLNGVDITAVGDGEIAVKAARNVVIKGKKILEN